MSDDTWTVAVEIPMSLPDEMRDSLFTAIADAAHAWEPEQRDGWDVNVTGHPIAREPSRAEAALQRVRTLAEEAIKGWEPERDYHQERARRKGYSLNEASAEIYGDAIEVLTEIIAALDPKDTP